MPREINAKFWFGDIVFLKVAQDRNPGMVTGVILRGNNSTTYEVTWDGGVTLHYDMELTTEFVPDWQNNG
jgi:hypothetical protein